MRRKRLADALFPKTRRDILAAMFVQPGRMWYMAELARHLSVPSSSLHRELASLAAAGIIKEHRHGRMVFFEANQDSVVFADLRGLLLKTAGLVDVLKEALQPISPLLRIAFVYGSIASGDERFDSDIDLLMVGDATPMDLAAPVRVAQERLGRELVPMIYTPAEFEKKREEHFLMRVLDKPMLFVIGSRDELGSLAEKQRRV